MSRPPSMALPIEVIVEKGDSCCFCNHTARLSKYALVQEPLIFIHISIEIGCYYHLIMTQFMSCRDLFRQYIAQRIQCDTTQIKEEEISSLAGILAAIAQFS